MNRHMPDYVVQRVVHGLGKRGLPVKGSRVLLLGLTYKYNATDLRNSLQRVSPNSSPASAPRSTAPTRTSWRATPAR